MLVCPGCRSCLVETDEDGDPLPDSISVRRCRCGSFLLDVFEKHFQWRLRSASGDLVLEDGVLYRSDRDGAGGDYAVVPEPERWTVVALWLGEILAASVLRS